MSFGKRKMHEVCDEKADTVLVCDHRGTEWMVIADGGDCHTFSYGNEPARGAPTRFFEANIDNVDEHFRPWAKQLLKRIKVHDTESETV